MNLESTEFLQVYMEAPNGHKTWFPVRRDPITNKILCDPRLFRGFSYGISVRDQIAKLEGIEI